MPILALSLLLLLFTASCAPSKADDLHAAARSGDPERVKAALEHGVDVNQIAEGENGASRGSESGQAREREDSSGQGGKLRCC